MDTSVYSIIEREIWQLEDALQIPHIINKEKAKEDFGYFASTILRGRDGSAFILRPYQKLWVEHFNYCLKNHKDIGLIAPFGTAKTTIMGIGATLWLIGKSPESFAGAIVCIEEDEAKYRLSVLSNYIKDSYEYLSIFTELSPSKTTWSKSAITVEHTYKKRRITDPTLVSSGIKSGAVSKRLNYILFDDIFGHKEVASEKELAIRENMLKNDWASRVVAEGTQIYLGNIWKKGDISWNLLSESNKGTNNFAFCHTYVDTDSIKEEVRKKRRYIVGGEMVVHSPAFLNGYQKVSLDKDTLKEINKMKHGSIREDTFLINWFNIQKDTGNLLFPNVDKIINYSQDLSHFLPGKWDNDEYIVDIDEAKRQGWFFTCGVDLASEKRRGTALVVVGISPSKVKVIVDYYLGAWTSPQTADMMKLIYRKWKVDVFGVESVAYQASLIEWMARNMHEYEFADKIIPIFTNKYKLDIIQGLPILDVEFLNKGWVFPAKKYESHSTFCDCVGCVFINQLVSATFSNQHDLVMALWFAERTIGFSAVNVIL